MLRVLGGIGCLIAALFILKEAFGQRNIKEGLRWLIGKTEEKDKGKETSNLTTTVLIPAYNEEDFIEETIKSVQNQSHPVDRILVVDDSSSDNTGLLAKDQGAEVLTTNKNTGTKAQAQQYGLQYIDTDIVINVDADTILEEDAIEKILPSFTTDGVASACGFVIPHQINTFWEKGRFIQYLFGISIYKQAQNVWSGVLVSSGCFSAFRVTDLKEIGGFPDRSIAEDMDATWLLLEQGKKVKLVAGALCYPKDPHNYQTYSQQVERWYRGFLQNISNHKLSLLANLRLTFFILWNLIGGLAFFVSIGLIGWWLNTIGIILILGIGIEVSIMAIATFWKAYRLNKLSLALRSFPCYFPLAYVDLYLFLKSIWLEWIQRDKLKIWQKGHGV